MQFASSWIKMKDLMGFCCCCLVAFWWGNTQWCLAIIPDSVLLSPGGLREPYRLLGMECSLATKKANALPAIRFLQTSMQEFILSVISQKDKVKHQIVTLICGMLNNMSKQRSAKPLFYCFGFYFLFFGTHLVVFGFIPRSLLRYHS